LIAAFIDNLVQWLGRSTSRAFMIGVVVLLTATFISHSSFAFGWKRTILFLLISAILPYLSEVLGLRFGIPFGRYRYTGNLGFVLPMGLPVYVMISWVLLLYSGIFVGEAVAVVFPALQGLWSQIFIISLLMVAVDAIIDPIAVKIGHWVWLKPGKWFGIPLQNFFGWFLTSIVTIYTFYSASGNTTSTALTEPRWLYFLPILMFGLLCLQFIGLLRKLSLKQLIPLALVLAISLVSLFYLIMVHGA